MYVYDEHRYISVISSYAYVSCTSDHQVYIDILTATPHNWWLTVHNLTNCWILLWDYHDSHNRVWTRWRHINEGNIDCSAVFLCTSHLSVETIIFSSWTILHIHVVGSSAKIFAMAQASGMACFRGSLWCCMFAYNVCSSCSSSFRSLLVVGLSDTWMLYVYCRSWVSSTATNVLIEVHLLMLCFVTVVNNGFAIHQSLKIH